MPGFKLRKVPRKDLFWVVDAKGKHYSKEGLPRDRAKEQLKALYAAESRGEFKEGAGPMGMSTRHISRGMKGKMLPLATNVAEAIVSNIHDPAAMMEQLTGVASGAGRTGAGSDDLALKRITEDIKREVENKRWYDKKLRPNGMVIDVKRKTPRELSQADRDKIRAEVERRYGVYEQQRAANPEAAEMVETNVNGRTVITSRATQQSHESEQKRIAEEKWRKEHPTAAWFKDFGKGVQEGVEMGLPILKKVPGIGDAVGAVENAYNTAKEVTGNFGQDGAGRKKKSPKWIQEAVEKKSFHEGAFTKQAIKHHMTPPEFMHEVLAHPEKYSKVTLKRAHFMKNISGGGPPERERISANILNIASAVQMFAEDYEPDEQFEQDFKEARAAVIKRKKGVGANRDAEGIEKHYSEFHHSILPLADAFLRAKGPKEVVAAAKPLYRLAERMGRKLALEGHGIKEWFSKAKDYVSRIGKVVTSGVRKGYAPAARQMLEKHGNGLIMEAYVRRDPIQSILHTALNAITLGKWNEMRSKLNYDKLFHLGLVVRIRQGQTYSMLVIEKNEVINIAPAKRITKDTGYMQVPLNGHSVSLNQLMDNAEKVMGKDFFLYDAFANNCQDFVMALLRGSGFGDARVYGFVKQPIAELIKGLPEYTQKVARTVTDIGAAANYVIEGEGKMRDMLKGCGMEHLLEDNKVVMKKADFVKEHKKLIGMLEKTGKEAKEQKAELKQVLSGGGIYKQMIRDVINDFVRQYPQYRPLLPVLRLQIPIFEGRLNNIGPSYMGLNSRRAALKEAVIRGVAMDLQNARPVMDEILAEEGMELRNAAIESMEDYFGREDPIVPDPEAFVAGPSAAAAPLAPGVGENPGALSGDDEEDPRPPKLPYHGKGLAGVVFKSLSVSPKKGKKWRVVLLVKGRNKTIDFGAKGMEDMTMHKDPKRRKLYIERHRARENWTKSGIMSPGFWSRWLLWEKPDINDALAFTRKKFKI